MLPLLVTAVAYVPSKDIATEVKLLIVEMLLYEVQLSPRSIEYDMEGLEDNEEPTVAIWKSPSDDIATEVHELDVVPDAGVHVSP
jgi:hypothetical protein